MPIKALALASIILLSACAAENSPVYTHKADDAMKAATYSQAVTAYEKSVNEKYHSYKFYEMRGDIANKFGEYGNAINDYTKSLDIMASDSVNMKRAVAYYKLKYFQDAEYDFSSVITTSKRYKAEAYAWRAKAELAEGKYKEALDDLDKVLKTSGESNDADRTLAEVYLKLGNVQEAMKYAVKAAAAYQDDPEMYFLRGQIFYKTKDANQAVSDYKTALKLRPGYTEAKYNLAWIYATCPAGLYRDSAQAEAMASEIYKSDNRGENAILLSAAYASGGNFDKAADLLKNASDAEKDFVLQDDMRMYMKMYQEKKMVSTW